MQLPFTDRVRRIMVLAHQEAKRLRHEQVDTGHLLLRLIDEGSGVAVHVLKTLGVDIARARRELQQRLLLIGVGRADVERPQYSQAAKTILLYSLQEARSAGHGYVGSEHLLLGMLRDAGSDAAEVLRNCGLEFASVRDAIAKLLGEPRDSERHRRAMPSHISTGPLGRAVLGLCAFLSFLAIGACATGLAVKLVAGPPRAIANVVLVHVLLDLFAAAAIFMLLVTISFWCRGCRWTDRLLVRTVHKGAVAVCIIVAAILGIVGAFLIRVAIEDPKAGIVIGGTIGLAVYVVAISIIVWRRKRARMRLNRDR